MGKLIAALLSLLLAAPAWPAFTFEDAIQNDGTGTTATCTFGAAPAENELVVVWYNVNGPPTGWTGPTGAGYTEAVNDSNSNGVETNQHALYYKIAGAAESASVTTTWTGSQGWQCLGMVFSANDTIQVELAAALGWDATVTDDLIIEAMDGRAYNSGELHVI